MHYIQPTGNLIINGDCLTALPQLADGSVDFVFTDPPYLVNYRDRQGRSLAGDNSSQWLKPAFADIYRVLKAGRYCVSFYGWSKADQFLAAWRTAGFYPAGRQAHLAPLSAAAGNGVHPHSRVQSRTSAQADINNDLRHWHHVWRSYDAQRRRKPPEPKSSRVAFPSNRDWALKPLP
jgi:hypothetical protein